MSPDDLTHGMGVLRSVGPWLLTQDMPHRTERVQGPDHRRQRQRVCFPRPDAAFTLERCRNVTVKNVNLFTAAGLGFLGQFSENITLKHTNVMPNYAKGCYLCGHADGFQVSNCRGQIVVDGCKFEGLMDDPINVHGTSVRIVAIRDERNVVCKFMHGQSTGMIWGDANGWYESGAVKDVLIRKTRFHPSCLTSAYQFGEGIISIYPIIPELAPGKPFHRNIRIENNHFDVFDYSVLYALSVDGLHFSNNSIAHNTQYRPWQGRKAMLTFEGCLDVQVTGNRIADDVLGKNIDAVNMSRAEIRLGPGQAIVQ